LTESVFKLTRPDSAKWQGVGRNARSFEDTGARKIFRTGAHEFSNLLKGKGLLIARDLRDEVPARFLNPLAGVGHKACHLI
jgi:hypothetical protein